MPAPLLFIDQGTIDVCNEIVVADMFVVASYIPAYQSPAMAIAPTIYVPCLGTGVQSRLAGSKQSLWRLERERLFEWYD